MSPDQVELEARWETTGRWRPRQAHKTVTGGDRNGEHKVRCGYTGGDHKTEETKVEASDLVEIQEGYHSVSS